MPRWIGVERIGTIVLGVLVVAILLVQAASVVLDISADDAFLRYDLLVGQPLERERTPYGIWLSGLLTADLGPTVSAQAMRERADALGHLASRLREIAGVSALAGLLVAPLSATAEREARMVRGREETTPAASTASNGTV
jgi:hypothetical protein